MSSRMIKLRNIKRALNVKPNSDPTSYILSGRVSNFRAYKSFNFIDLIDGSTKKHLQVVIDKSLLKKPELGSYLKCQGNIIESRGKDQSIEFKVEKLIYLGKCDPTIYPLATAASPTSTNSHDWYRSMPHLRPRAVHFESLLRIRSELELSLHMIMKQMDFFRVHTPSLSSNDSEASSDLFIVKRSKLSQKLQGNQIDASNDNAGFTGSDDEIETGYQSDYSSDEVCERAIEANYFNKDVYLITSAQLHLENLAASLSRVYTLSNAFRAENSNTTRHLCEFLMFEAEEANVEEVEQLMNRVESIIKFSAHYLSEVSEHKEDFETLLGANKNSDNFKKLIQEAYIRMSYKEALEILGKQKAFLGPTSYGSDLSRLHEKELLRYCNNVPLYITNFPAKLKPFYMKQTGDGGGHEHMEAEALCFDLIMPLGGEVCGGSLREDNFEKLRSSLKRMSQTSMKSSKPSEFEIAGATQSSNGNQNRLGNSFDWYLDLRRFGSFPHGGFGIGIERLLQSMLGLSNIKDTTAFPRWPGHCSM